jgi:glutathione peroxidase
VTDNYNIDFPMFSKIEVNGDGACGLYDWLKSEQPGEGETSDITWNFEKFLVNSAGDVVARFSPMVTPEEVAEQLPTLLG